MNILAKKIEKKTLENSFIISNVLQNLKISVK